MAVAYQSTTDPRKVAENNRALIQQQGDDQIAANNQAGQQEQTRRGSTADYLNDIEDPLAQGQGGYNAQETAGIQGDTGPAALSNLYNPSAVSPSDAYLQGQQLTPEQQQQMVTSAGISAGAQGAAAKDQVGRATAAAGGNPLALAAYQGRQDRQSAGEAGDAMTNARIAASNAGASRAAGAEATREAGGSNAFNEGMGVNTAGSNRAATIGNTRLGQQQQGLQYYQGQNQQANENAQSDASRAAQVYGTQAGGENQATSTAVNASQTPSTFDKVLGAASGALKFLADGDVMGGGQDAIVGENGPEKVVNTSYMDEGGFAPDSYGMISQAGDPGTGVTQPGGGITDSYGMTTQAGDPGTAVTQPSWMQRMRTRLAQDHAAPAATQQPNAAPGKWNPVDTYKDIGQAAGLAISHLDKGGVAGGMRNVSHGMPGGIDPYGGMQKMPTPDGIFTAPTHVKLDPNEAVVPLSYKPEAKARPSMASLPAAKQRHSYKGGRHG